ncbi:MAG: S46 family peptidase [Paludibacter sp.]|nr:S46 family peptidase [Paludibacter sp.]
MKKILLYILAAFCVLPAMADEGMWMLPLIKKLNIKKMQGLGCVLTAEEIYSTDSVSLKDAVVIFGNGCTGVMVSPEGLVFTNHHCGYNAIQELSSVENNYLKNGYTAVNISDEIPAPGLTVTFLNRIEDVTEQVLSKIPADLTGAERSKLQDSICTAIAKNANDTTLKLTAQVKPYFSNNQFYLLVYQKYNDVRFAYAPPASIGKFGGDTDNWMWPRHTGDFSVFRVYSDKNGLPAAYSADNVPYSPHRFAKISVAGYKEGDFSMILGNPGSTERYATSWQIQSMVNGENQARIDVRGAKQDVWKSFMQKDEAIQLAYASKYAQSSNYWKNSIGMNKAIAKLKIINVKENEQRTFEKWVKQSPERVKKYGKVLDNLKTSTENAFIYEKNLNLMYESLLSGVEMTMIALRSGRIGGNNQLSREEKFAQIKKLYDDYYPQVDKATMAKMLAVYRQYADEQFLPSIYSFIDKKFKGNYEKYADYVFEKSAFTTFDKLQAAINSKKGLDTKKDPGYEYYQSVITLYRQIISEGEPYSTQVDNNQRIYQAALLEMAQQTGKALYPDANFTMRMTYGTIGGYVPADAQIYKYYSTVKGISEKGVPGDYEFDVPEKLSKALKNKEYIKYTDPKTGEMNVCFLSNNDITGGNSGSPVFNAKGELIGLAFDGNWEAMSGDIVFDNDLQRTISVDIRYVLFIMDKVGDAQRLLKELEIAE